MILVWEDPLEKEMAYPSVHAGNLAQMFGLSPMALFEKGWCLKGQSILHMRARVRVLEQKTSHVALLSETHHGTHGWSLDVPCCVLPPHARHMWQALSKQLPNEFSALFLVSAPRLCVS